MMNRKFTFGEVCCKAISATNGRSGSTRIALSWSVLVILVVVLTTYFFFASLLTDEKKKISVAAKEEMTHVVGERTSDLLTLAAISLAAAVRDPLLERESKRVRHVISVLAGQKYVTAVAVADRNGKIVAAHDAALVGMNAADRFPELIPTTGILVRGGVDGGTAVAAPVTVFAKQIGTVILVYRR